MIARRWHGLVPNDKAKAYLSLMQTVAVDDYRSVEGNEGVWCLHRVDGDVTHFEMLTFWTDIDSIKRFAGEDYTTAKYYEFDAGFLIEMEQHVLHFEVDGG